MSKVTVTSTLVIVTVICCLVSNGAIADTISDPQNALQQAASLYSQDKYVEAIPILQQGLALAGTDRAMVEELKSYLAFSYTALGDMPNANKASPPQAAGYLPVFTFGRSNAASGGESTQKRFKSPTNWSVSFPTTLDGFFNGQLAIRNRASILTL